MIYHHFRDKASLLRAAIERHIVVDKTDFTPETLPELPLEEGLRLVLRKFLSDIDRPGFVAFTRVLLGEAMRRPEFARILSEVMVERMFTALTAFFSASYEAGNLREMIPPLRRSGLWAARSAC